MSCMRKGEKNQWNDANEPKKEIDERKQEAWHVTHCLNWEWSVSGAGLAPPAGWRKCTTTGVENHVLPPSCRCTRWAPQLTTWCSWCTGCHWDQTCWTAFQNSSHSQKTYERGGEQDNAKSSRRIAEWSFDKCFILFTGLTRKVWKPLTYHTSHRISVTFRIFLVLNMSMKP